MDREREFQRLRLLRHKGVETGASDIGGHARTWIGRMRDDAHSGSPPFTNPVRQLVAAHDWHIEI